MQANLIAKEWIAFGDMDLDVAKYLLEKPKRPNEIICYHCQQAAEKYLKAYLLMNGEEVEKTHNLIALCKKSSKYDIDFNDILNECADLTPYGVAVRYPFNMEVNDSDVLIAITNAENIVEFIGGLCERR